MADSEKDKGAWWVFGFGAVGALVLLLAYARFRSGFAIGTIEAHAQLGDALGPVVAFLTLFTVVAALWSVQIQRQELRETREEMAEQRKQFQRTAEAQEALAESQQQLAEAQRAANEEAAALRYAQHSSNIAALLQTLASLDVAEANGAVTNSALFNQRLPALNQRRAQLNARLNKELLAEQLVADALRLGFGVDPALNTKVATGADDDND